MDYDQFKSLSLEHIYRNQMPQLRSVFLARYARGTSFESLPEDERDYVHFLVEEASTLNRPDMIDLIIEVFGAMLPKTKTDMFWTHYNCSLEFLQRLHQHGLELDQINVIGGFDNVTPLYSYASVGHVEGVKYLLEMGADPTIRSKTSFPPDELPLEAAYSADHFEVVKLLATPQTIRMPPRIDKDFDSDGPHYFIDFLEVARAEKKDKYIQLFESILSNEKE